MPLRLSIPKLAAAAIAPLHIAPRFHSDLLRSRVKWPQDVNYLRDTYMDAYALWDELAAQEPEYSPENDKRLFTGSSPKIRELVVGLQDVLKQIPHRFDLVRMLQNANDDFSIGESYGNSGDFATATVYQSYSLLKLHRILDHLTLMANKKQASKHVEAYGYDISGEVMEPGEQESRSPNLWDQGNSPKFDRTPINPANSMVDPEAENDFPELKETKHKRIDWPARSR